MKLNEKDIIRLIFIIFIIIGFIVLLWNYNKTVIEGSTNMDSGCNDCRISPEYSPTATTFYKVLTDANNEITANYTSGAGIGSGFLNNYFGSATQGDNCVNLNLRGQDQSYIFCPWQPGNSPYLTNPDIKCPSNTFVGSDNTSFCCSNNSFNNDNYLLLDDPSKSKIYGLVFEVQDFSSKTSTTRHQQSLLGSRLITSSDALFTQNLYEFKYPVSLNRSMYSISGFDISLSVNKSTAEWNAIYQSFSGTDNETAITDKYINCSGQEISFNYLDNVAYISKACQNLYPNIGYGKHTIGDGVTFCMQNEKYCEISNVMTDCSLLLPKYTPANEWYRISQSSGAQASPGGGFDIDGSIQPGLQSAVDQLVSKFTQQITSLTSQIGESLQFPNLGQVKYLDVGACNNNAPYVYNSGCDTSLGYLGQYTCYPSLTGAFSDCGPPGYDAKPQF